MSGATTENRHSDSSDDPSVVLLATPEPPSVAVESDADASTTAYDAPQLNATTAPADTDDDGADICDSSSVVARGLSSMLSSVIRDFDSRAEETGRSQDQLSFAIDRLTKELDQLLEDAPLPFIMQHAVKISVIRKRVSSLNMLLKSIQRRLDNVDRMLSVGLLQDKGAAENVRPN